MMKMNKRESEIKRRRRTGAGQVKELPDTEVSQVVASFLITPPFGLLLYWVFLLNSCI